MPGDSPGSFLVGAPAKPGPTALESSTRRQNLHCPWHLEGPVSLYQITRKYKRFPGFLINNPKYRGQSNPNLAQVLCDLMKKPNSIL